MSKAKRIVIIAALVIFVAGLVVYNGMKILKGGAEAYLFGYSPVLVDTTRQAITDPNGGRAPVNHFAHIMGFPDHNFRRVVLPNCDTLYSTAFIDLSKEPLILSVPDTAGRYYVMPFMDAYTNVFASVGKRVTGTQAGHYLVAGPNWQGQVPGGIEMIRSPTNMIWLIGRIQANGKSDFPDVHKLQEQFKLTPLSRWDRREANRSFWIFQQDPQGKTENPSDMVARMSVGEFFAALSRLMAEQPPPEADAPILKTLAEFGVVPGLEFDTEKQGRVRRLLLKKAVAVARRKLKEIAESDRSSENNWAVVRDGIGVYGTNYGVRAFVSLIGLGALTPAEAAYPNALKDGAGNALHGANRYRIHFEAGKTPPVDAFWSLTMYDERGFLIKNPINRYAIGDRDPLKVNTDGSLDIIIQHERPDRGEQNWLPAPADEFAVTLRLYLPQADFLNGTWKVPPIERTN